MYAQESRRQILIPCILLGAHHILASQVHCDSTVVEVPHHGDIFLSCLDRPLARGHLVALKGHRGLTLSTVSCSLFELFSKPKSELNAPDGCLGDHCPVSTVLRDGHNRGGCHGDVLLLVLVVISGAAAFDKYQDAME